MFFDRDHIEDAQALVVSDRELLAGLDQESVGRLTDLLSKSRVEPVPEHCILRSGTRPTPPSQDAAGYQTVSSCWSRSRPCPMKTISEFSRPWRPPGLKLSVAGRTLVRGRLRVPPRAGMERGLSVAPGGLQELGRRLEGGVRVLAGANLGRVG